MDNDHYIEVNGEVRHATGELYPKACPLCGAGRDRTTLLRGVHYECGAWYGHPSQHAPALRDSEPRPYGVPYEGEGCRV